MGKNSELDIVKRPEDGCIHRTVGIASIIHSHIRAHKNTHVYAHTHTDISLNVSEMRKWLPEVTKGSTGLTSELTDSLSDYTVSAQTETGTHQGGFNTGNRTADI